MGSGKGQAKRVNATTAERARVIADHQEFWPWIKENGLNQISLSEYYLSGLDLEKNSDLTPEQVSYVFTEYFRDLVLESKCLKININDKEIDPYEYKIEYDNKTGTLSLIKAKKKKVLGEWSHEHLRGEPLLQNITFKASSQNIDGFTGTNYLSIISNLFKNSSF